MIPAHFFIGSISYFEIRKGGMDLPAIGYIQVHAYTSRAQIPLSDTAVTVTDASGSAIAMRLTGRSGQLDEPIPITVPDVSAGQSPNTGIIPFAIVNLYAKHKNYEEIDVRNLQIFPGVVTLQNLDMIPLSELPGAWNSAEIFPTPPQNL